MPRMRELLSGLTVLADHGCELLLADESGLRSCKTRGCLPDLSDPATQGCVINTLCAQCEGKVAVVMQPDGSATIEEATTFVSGVGPMRARTLLGGGPSLGVALVSALAAISRRKGLL